MDCSGDRIRRYYSFLRDGNFCWQDFPVVLYTRDIKNGTALPNSCTRFSQHTPRKVLEAVGTLVAMSVWFNQTRSYCLVWAFTSRKLLIKLRC